MRTLVFVGVVLLRSCRESLVIQDKWVPLVSQEMRENKVLLVSRDYLVLMERE